MSCRLVIVSSLRYINGHPSRLGPGIRDGNDLDTVTHLENDLGRRRQAAGLTQAALAERVGLSRQAFNALEAGRSVPSVQVALRLARALDCRVEDLFRLGGPDDTLEAVAAEPATSGRVVVGCVDDRWVAHPLRQAEPGALRTSADGVVVGQAGPLVRIELLRPREALPAALLCAGCAPALGLLGARLEAAHPPQRVHWLEHGSTAALDLLAAGAVHLAGSHLLDEATGEYNLPELRRRLPRRSMEVYALARWEVGLVLRPGLKVRGVAELPGLGGGVVGRETGSGADRLLRHLLRGAGLPETAVTFTGPPARGHLEAARRVAEGRADACLAIRSAAVAWELDFVPLAEERFDLVFEAGLAGDARVVRLLDTLASLPFRRELRSLGGHFTEQTAAHVGRTEAA